MAGAQSLSPNNEDANLVDGQRTQNWGESKQKGYWKQTNIIVRWVSILLSFESDGRIFLRITIVAEFADLRIVYCALS